MLAAATCLTFAALPPTPETPRTFDLAMGIVALGLAGLVLTLLPHLRDDWGLDLGLGVAVVLSGLGAVWMPKARDSSSSGSAWCSWASTPRTSDRDADSSAFSCSC